MKSVARFLHNLLNREEGQTLSEYGIILFFLVLIAVGAVTLFGENVVAMWVDVSEAFDLI